MTIAQYHTYQAWNRARKSWRRRALAKQILLDVAGAVAAMSFIFGAMILTGAGAALLNRILG